MPDPARAALENALGAERLVQQVELAPYTTFRIGGAADLFYEARTVEELVRAITVVRGLRRSVLPFSDGEQISW